MPSPSLPLGLLTQPTQPAAPSCVCEVPGFGRLATEPRSPGPAPDDPAEWEQARYGRSVRMSLLRSPSPACSNGVPACWRRCPACGACRHAACAALPARRSHYAAHLRGAAGADI